MNDRRRTTDERIAAAARELVNPPPETPRDEMWAAIEGRLPAGSPGDTGGGAAGSAGPAVLPPAPRSREPRDSRLSGGLGWWIGIAAALAIGLGLGRLSQRTDAADPRVAATPEASETVVAREDSSPAGEAGRAAPEGAAAGDAEDSPRADAPDADRRLAAAPPEADGEAPGGAPERPAGEVGGRRNVERLPYQMATREHLGRSETFLAGVRAGLEGQGAGSDYETWARSLLTRTRVLMASPAGDDPETRRLLEDLELMLAQIVVTATSGDPGEARIVGEGLEDGDLLYRLRSATENTPGPGMRRPATTSSL